MTEQAVKNATPAATITARITARDSKKLPILCSVVGLSPSLCCWRVSARVRIMAGTTRTVTGMPSPGAAAISPKHTPARVTIKNNVLSENVAGPRAGDVDGDTGLGAGCGQTPLIGLSSRPHM